MDVRIEKRGASKEYTFQEFSNVFEYIEFENEIHIKKMNEFHDVVEIPERFSGKPITVIYPFACAGMKIVELILPKQLQVVGTKAFADNNIKKLSFVNIEKLYKDAFLNNPIASLITA